MKYMGSKSRVSKYIVPIIQEKINSNNIQTYIEPFVGGANIIDKIACPRKIGSDNNPYLIALYENLDKIPSLPEFVTREHYAEVKNDFHSFGGGYFPDWYIGAVGFLASYNGKFFDGGYAGTAKTKIGTVRNYYDEAKRNLLNQIKDLENIEFMYGDYEHLYKEIKDCCIYCDIPYKDSTKYSTSKNFDYTRFWTWAERMSTHNIVLVSEHQAPENWECIWQQEVKRTMDNKSRLKAVEKLFCIRSNKNENIKSF